MFLPLNLAGRQEDPAGVRSCTNADVRDGGGESVSSVINILKRGTRRNFEQREVGKTCTQGGTTKLPRSVLSTDFLRYRKKTGGSYREVAPCLLYPRGRLLRGGSFARPLSISIEPISLRHRPAVLRATSIFCWACELMAHAQTTLRHIQPALGVE